MPTYAVRAPLARWLAEEAARAAADFGRYRLLDAGCGEKPYAALFAPYVSEHVGLDNAAHVHADLERPLDRARGVVDEVAVGADSGGPCGLFERLRLEAVALERLRDNVAVDCDALAVEPRAGRIGVRHRLNVCRRQERQRRNRRRDGEQRGEAHRDEAGDVPHAAAARSHDGGRRARRGLGSTRV